MRNFKKSMVTLLGLIALIGAVAAITPFKGYGQQSPDAVAAVQDVRVVNTGAAPVPVRDVDAPRANEIITLQYTGGSFKRRLSSGELGVNEFVVPANRVLIVTDVEWTVQCNGCASIQLELYITPGSGQYGYVYVSYLKVDDVNYRSGTTDHMETGFAVAAGNRIRPFLSSSGLSRLFLHGYFVSAT